MFNLKLPDIEPQGPVVSAASEIDRAGAAIKGATSAIGDVFAQASMAQTATDLQEATLKTTKGLNDTLDTIESNPWVTPEQVRTLFNGKVPEGITLTEQVATPGGPVEQDKKIIPMHEIAPALFDAHANAAVDNAVGGIRGAGWQRKFREMAAKDVEAARTRAMEWQRGQMLADAEVRSVAQFKQAIAARQWNTAEGILNMKGPNGEPLTMSVKTHAELVAAYPTLRAHAQASDAIGAAGTPEELDKVITKIQENKSGDPEKGEFATPLSVEDQHKFTDIARERKREIVSEQAAAAKRQKEMLFQAVGNQVEAAVVQSRKTGLPATNYFSVAELGQYADKLDVEDFEKLRGYLEARTNQSRQTDLGVWTKLAEMKKNGVLGQMSSVDLMGYAKYLSESDYQQVGGWWMEAKQNPGASKPPFNDAEEKAIDDVLLGPMKLDPPTQSPKARADYIVKRAMLQRSLLQWKKNHPDEPMLADAVFTEAAALWPQGIEADPKSASGRAALQMTLGTVLGHVPTQPEIDEHLRAIDEQAPFFDAAAAALLDPKQVDITPSLRARVYGMTVNPTTRKTIEGLIRDRNPGVAVTEQAVVREAVSLLFPDTVQGQQYRDRQADKATQAAKAREATAAGSALAARTKAAEAATSAEADRLTAAERDRWSKLPTWEQQAELYEKKLVRDDEAGVERIVRQKVYAEERAARAATGAHFDEKLRPALEARIKAETQEAVVRHRPEIQARMADAKVQYRAFLERVNAGDPASVQAYQTMYLDNFVRWFEAKREGRVQ